MYLVKAQSRETTKSTREGNNISAREVNYTGLTGFTSRMTGNYTGYNYNPCQFTTPDLREMNEKVFCQINSISR